jgi:1-acyl-sn-glycerol-3-phosphate acyltransferase
MNSVLHLFFKVEIAGKIKYNKPVIYAPLHSYHNNPIDVLSLSLFGDNVDITISSKMIDPVKKVVAKNCIIIKGSYDNNFKQFIKKGKKSIKNNRNIIIFPEGKHAKKKWCNVLNWKQLEEVQSGCFSLSRKTGIAIVPVIIENTRSTKGFITPGTLRIHCLPKLCPHEFSSTEKMVLEYKKVINEKLKNI